MRPSWTTEITVRNGNIPLKEWDISDEGFGTTKIRMNAMGELWAIGEGETEGVCLACFLDQYELLTRIVEQARLHFEQHTDSDERQRT